MSLYCSLLPALFFFMAEFKGQHSFQLCTPRFYPIGHFPRQWLRLAWMASFWSSFCMYLRGRDCHQVGGVSSWSACHQWWQQWCHQWLQWLVHLVPPQATCFEVYTAREYFFGPSRWWNRFDVLLTAALVLESLGPNAYIHTSQCVAIIMSDHVDNRCYHSCVRVWLFSWCPAGHVSDLGGSNWSVLLGGCDWVNSQPVLSFRRSSDTQWQYLAEFVSKSPLKIIQNP